MLEFALDRYPLHLCLPDGLEIKIRPVDQYDEERFQQFMLEVPAVDRLHIKDRLTDRTLFQRWCHKIDYQTNLPLFALDGEQLAAVGTLHQRHGGWRRNIGSVSVIAHPRYRGRGLVNVLLKELIDISTHDGLSKLEAEFLGECEDGIRVFSSAGFDQLVRLPDYVQDMEAGYHDYVLMGMDLQPPEELCAAGD
jgi:L-amino acid N-acyltransferase YncA